MELSFVEGLDGNEPLFHHGNFTWVEAKFGTLQKFADLHFPLSLVTVHQDVGHFLYEHIFCMATSAKAPAYKTWAYHLAVDEKICNLARIYRGSKYHAANYVA